MTDSPPPPDFIPVPVAARHDGWTPARQRLFIAQLDRIGLVGAAARAAGMTAKSAYRLRARADAASFAAAWDTALAQGLAMAEETAIDRALNGTQMPVFFRGRRVGRRTVHHDGLLIAALRERSRRLTQPAQGGGGSSS